MSAPVGFLHALAHAFSTLALYQPGHPAREAAVDDALDRLDALRRETPAPRFSFLDEAIVFGDLPLHELRGWPWANRLAALGIQRVEFDPGTPRDGLAAFLEDIVARIAAGPAAAGGAQHAAPGVRWGAVGIAGDMAPVAPSAPAVGMAYRLGDEAELVRWLYDQAGEGEIVRSEVDAVVTSLAVAMHGEQALQPLIELRGGSAYGSVHAMHVATLAMALAEHLGMGSRDVRALGTAALLCDVGMTKVPKELLSRPKLSPAERAEMESHTIEGARMLLARKGQFDLAAVVAYEHHLQPDGLGYPALHFPREAHYASRIVHVADVYDALRTAGQSRPAWEPEEALRHIELGAGTLFDAGIARSFAAMIRQAEARTAS
jgi:putative nucleotidyltransferase with HDIG domain